MGTPQIESLVIDAGLGTINANVTAIYIVGSVEPTTYALATTGAGNSGALGYKSFGAGSTFGAPAANGSTARKVSSTSVADGTITTAGTACYWAAVSGSALYAHGSLSANTAVAVGNFTLASFDITIPMR